MLRNIVRACVHVCVSDLQNCKLKWQEPAPTSSTTYIQRAALVQLFAVTQFQAMFSPVALACTVYNNTALSFPF